MGVKKIFPVLMSFVILLSLVGCRQVLDKNSSVGDGSALSETVSVQTEPSDKDEETSSVDSNTNNTESGKKDDSKKFNNTSSEQKTSSKEQISTDKNTKKPDLVTEETEKAEVKDLNFLNNTYYKLTKEKRLNIAYFGGSITAGFGASSGKSWRELTTAYFKRKFPNATITETNAAIGGTGSIYGIYRAVTDLKLESETEKPDLVFIEFAVNDYLDGMDYEEAKKNMECLVRTIYEYSPNTDIFIVLTTNTLFCNNLSLSVFPQAKAHIDLAEEYKIPYLAVGAMLWDLTNEQIAEMKLPSDQQYAFRLTYFGDGTHPSNRGYIKYAEFIKTYLDEIFESKADKSVALKASYKPSKSIYKLPISPYMTNFKGVTTEILNATIDANGYLTSATENMTFTVEFKGTDLKIWHWSTPTSGSVSVTVDDGKTTEIDLCRSAENNKIFTLANGLENTDHTVKITLNKTANGTNMDIRNFLISGDKTKSGILLK